MSIWQYVHHESKNMPPNYCPSSLHTDQFSKFFHWHAHQKICHKMLLKNPPCLRCIAKLPCKIKIFKKCSDRKTAERNYDHNHKLVLSQQDQLKFSPMHIAIDAMPTISYQRHNLTSLTKLHILYCVLLRLQANSANTVLAVCANQIVRVRIIWLIFWHTWHHDYGWQAVQVFYLQANTNITEITIPHSSSMKQSLCTHFHMELTKHSASTQTRNLS